MPARTRLQAMPLYSDAVYQYNS